MVKSQVWQPGTDHKRRVPMDEVTGMAAWNRPQAESTDGQVTGMTAWNRPQAESTDGQVTGMAA